VTVIAPIPFLRPPRVPGGPFDGRSIEAPPVSPSKVSAAALRANSLSDFTQAEGRPAVK
jgi:hypothetical protein